MFPLEVRQQNNKALKLLIRERRKQWKPRTSQILYQLWLTKYSDDLYRDIIKTIKKHR